MSYEESILSKICHVIGYPVYMGVVEIRVSTIVVVRCKEVFLEEAIQGNYFASMHFAALGQLYIDLHRHMSTLKA